MNFKFLFNVFAWLSIIALSLSIITDFWLPMLVGAVVATLMIQFAQGSRY
jgi:hypothetical protein